MSKRKPIDFPPCRTFIEGIGEVTAEQCKMYFCGKITKEELRGKAIPPAQKLS